MAICPCNNDPDCPDCNERERLVALDLERGLRSGGRLRLIIAQVQASAKRLRNRRGEA